MVAKNFNFAVGEIFKHEGGYVDHKRDPGGATNMGITHRALAAWRGVKPYNKLPKSEVKNLKKAEAKKIYKTQYWDKIKGNNLPSGLDLALFDFAVNSGVSRAAKFLQAQVKVRQDGIIGPITLAAIERKIAQIGVKKIIQNLSRARLSFLRRLKIFSTFGKGWKRRVASVELTALKLAKTSPKFLPNQKPTKGNKMNILSGYKTYIMGAIMLLAAIAQIAGLDLPGFEGQNAMELMLQALAFIFLRKGIKSGIGGV